METTAAKETNMDANHQTRPTLAKHTGGCHCGAVRFEVELDLSEPASRCNCSICTKIAQTGRIVKPEAFKLLAGAADLGSYQWGGKTGTRHFCKHCGIHVFGPGNLPQLGGDYISVNVNCFDDIDPSTLSVIYFDGRHNNWQAGPRRTPWPVKGAPAPALAA